MLSLIRVSLTFLLYWLQNFFSFINSAVPWGRQFISQRRALDGLKFKGPTCGIRIRIRIRIGTGTNSGTIWAGLS
jgi:hypothetical protein